MKRIQNRLQIHRCQSLGMIAAYGVLVMLTGCDFGRIADVDDRETGPKDVPVFPDMLIGAQYRGRTGGTQYDDLSWIFDETHFRIVAGKSGLPSDLRATLLPKDVTGYRIDGQWKVDGETLTLSGISVDGVPIERPPRTLRTMCTPVIRIQAADQQYMFARGTAETARRQGTIPEWPIGTMMLSGSVVIPNNSEGWMSAGYFGYSVDGELISGSVTLRVREGGSSASGISKSKSPRNVRLQIDKTGHAIVRCMGLPPGDYLLYAKWTDPDPSEAKEVDVSFKRFRLIGNFVTQWVSVSDQLVSGVVLNLASVTRGDLAVEAPAVAESESDGYQSAFLLPWTDEGLEPHDLTDQQAWELAFQLGHQVPLDSGHAIFRNVPSGRHRIFYVRHDELSRDDDQLNFYRVVSDETVSLPAKNTSVPFDESESTISQ